MKTLKILKNNKQGMALIIVLTASFLALVIVGVGATMLASNLDKITSVVNRNKADENIQSAFERVRAMEKVNNTYLSGCNTGDCINTSNATCGTCADTIIDLGNGNQHKVAISTITQPQMGENGFLAGSVNILVTGYYKNLARQRAFTVCLNYCAVAGYNCGDNGCAASCGPCTLPDTCGGGGETGICGSITCPNDVAVECNSACVAGNSCGGGRIIDVANHIVAVGGGCTRTDGAGCGGGTDILTKAWDNIRDGGDTGATNTSDGRENATTLRNLGGGETIPANYEAVAFCDALIYQSFIDWYLPAQDELNALYTAYNLQYVADFSGNLYWSSTETSSKEAFSLDFGGGASATPLKNQAQYLRCLRRW